MGEETNPSNNTDDGPVEKAYCCSNYPQTEAKLIAKFDLVLELIGFASFIIAIATVASKENRKQIIQDDQQLSNLSNTEQNDLSNDLSNITSDLTMFFQWSKERKLVTMSLSLVCCTIGMIFSSILWLGVNRKNHAYLLTWFIFTLICAILFTIIGIIMIVNASNKAILCVTTVSFFLYKWYCLWIVKLLMSEIRAVREGYTNPLDDTDLEQTNNLVLHSDSFTVDKF